MKLWAELPVASQVKRIRGALAGVLPQWGIGHGKLQYIFHGENTTFRARGRRGDVLVRAHRAGYNTPEATESEIAWVRAVHRDTRMAPEPLLTHHGGLIARLNVPGVPVSHVSVLHWANGSVVGSEFSLETVRKMGILMATLHTHAASWRRPKWFSRPVYGFGEEFTGKNPAWNGMPPAFRSLVREFTPEAAREFARLVKNGETGLLHSDLHRRNIVRTKAGLVAIDFDDCGFRPWVQDVAVAAAFWDKRQGERLDALLQGYASVRSLPHDHLKMLPHFVAARLSGVALWMIGRARENAQFRKVEKTVVARLFKLARRSLRT